MSKRLSAIILGATLLLTTTLASQAGNESASRIRDALAGALGASLCSGAGSGWCAALGVQTAYWVDKGVSFAIDRYYEAKDQAFADKHGITICYRDGHCIRPHN